MLTTRPTPIDERLRADGNQGAVAVFELDVRPYADGPPLHVQPSLDTSFYVLEGRVVFQVDDVMLTALPGASVFAPRGARQAYANPTAEAARVLVVSTPGTFCEPHGTEGERSAHVSEIVGPPLAN
jgi:quercetin dioxygenase-like cupin family protein